MWRTMHRAVRRIAAHLIFVWPFVTACSSGSSAPEARPCERLRAHVVEVSLSDLTAEQRAQHRALLEQALGDFVDTCTTALTETQVDCALEATTSSALKSCTSR